MEQIAEGIVARAKAGDAKAIDSLMKLIGTGQQLAQPKVVERVVEVEKPVFIDKPVMVAGVQEQQLRQLVACRCLIDGQISRAAVSKLTGLADLDLEALLNHDWFRSTGSGWEITPAGRQAVG